MKQLYLNKRISMAAMLTTAFLTGCAITPAPKADYTVYRQHMPKSILVLPPINDSPDVRATYSVLSSTTAPIAEAGYYVFPVALVEQTFKENGLSNPAEIQQVPTQKLQEIFGADAALYMTVTEYGSKYQILQSTTSVAATAKLIDLKTGAQLWQGTQRLDVVDGGDQGAGIVGLLVNAAISQIANNLTDKAYPVAGLVNRQMLSPIANPSTGLLHGARSPQFVPGGQ